LNRKVFKTKLGFPPKTNLCRSCRYSYGSVRYGLTCGVTQKKPDFFGYCPYFALDKTRDIRAHSRDDVDNERSTIALKAWIKALIIIFFLGPFIDLLGEVAIVIMIAIIIATFIVTFGISEYRNSQNKGLPSLGFTYIKFLSFLVKNNGKDDENREIARQTLIRLYGNELTNNYLKYKEKLPVYDSIDQIKYYLPKEEKKFLFSLLNIYYVYNNIENYLKDGKIEAVGRHLGILEADIKKLKYIYSQAEKARQQKEKENQNRQKQGTYINFSYGERYYKILGLNTNASVDEIKKQFRILAKQYHPDKYTDENAAAQAEQKFKEILRAYEALKALRGFS